MHPPRTHAPPGIGHGVVIAALLTLCLSAGVAHAADIFVDPATGDDSRDGLSLATSVKTVQRGFNLVGSVGTLHLAAGDYIRSQGQTFPASAGNTTAAATRSASRASRSGRATRASAAASSLASRSVSK